MTVKSITQITDHQELADSRLPAQYAEAPGKYPNFLGADDISGWTGTLYSFTQPAQDLENIMISMLNERGLTTSVGVNLDRIGQIVGQDRQGNNDEDYLSIIGAQIAENNSDGTADELLSISKVLLGDQFISIEIKEGFPATAIIDIEVTDPITTPNNNEAVAAAIQGAKAAGVGVYLEIFTENYFAFDSDSSAGSLGYGNLDFDTNVSYYTNYTFPTTIPDISYNRYIDTSTSGNSRELGFVLTVAQFPLFTAELDSLSKGFDIVDQNGVRFTFINYAGTPVQYNTQDQTPDQYRLWIELSTNDASPVPLGDLYKDGVLLDFADWDDEFYFAFGTYFRGDEAAYNANNPNGLGNESTPPPELVGGGNYTNIIT